jgi:hypothetical protein
MRYDEFVDALFLAIGRAADIAGVDRFIDAKRAATTRELRFPDGWLLEAAQDLDRKGWLHYSPTLGAVQVRLTGRGWDRYQDLIDEDDLREDDAAAESTAVPASDRIVRLDHNSPAYLEADSKLSAMVAAVRANNEYAVTEPEDYEQTLAELESGQRLLKAPQVRLNAISTVLIDSLKKLAAKFGDAMLGALATVALAALAAYLGLSVPGL